MTFKSIFLILALILSVGLIFADDPKEQEIYEEFALSDKREEVLKKLIPGTEIYYFLHTLHLQQTGKTKEASDMLQKWEEIFPTSNQIDVMKNRQALLNFEKSPELTYQFLKETLNLKFEHIKPTSTNAPFYLNTLNPNVYHHEVEFNSLLSSSNNLDGFTNAGLFQISKRKLTSEQLQNLLNNYPYCDLPNTVDLVIKDFQNYEKRSFGNLSIHLKLTLSQLNELKNKKPILLTHATFIKEYLTKLSANQPARFSNKPLLLKKHLLDCWAFAKGLEPSFNSLKAYILYSYLTVCLELNEPDYNLFLEFLKLPRMATYANNEYYQKSNPQNAYIQFDKSYPEICQLPPITSDNNLLETYLYQLIKSSAKMSDYQIYFEKSYFNRFEAETKIKTGLGKPEDFYHILNTSNLEHLKNSVEISFTEQNAKFHLTNDSVKLSLQIKNINELEIQIFKLNMLDYYRNKNIEIEQNISLEGYIPNITKKFSYKLPSHIRHEETIELTEITNPGVYIIELYGNGIKTRTFLRKGTIFPAIYESNSGHEIQLFDDNQNQIINYRVFFGKHVLPSDDKGIVMIPYTDDKNTGVKNLIFSYQEIACLHQFNHQQENIEFSNLILNTLESLIPSQNAKIMFRPCLKQNNKPIGTSGLKDIKIELQLMNTANELLSSQTLQLEKLDDSNEISTYIPESAAKLILKLSAITIKKTDGQQKVLRTNNEIILSGAKAHSNMLGIYLRKQKDIYQLECLNKAGIPQVNVCIQLTLHHQFLTNPYTTTLQTNQKGIIVLDKLTDIHLIEVKDFNHQPHMWGINAGTSSSRPIELIALQNDLLEIPVEKINIKSLSESFVLLRYNNSCILEDHTAELKIENEMLKIPTSKVGQFKLHDKRQDSELEILILNGKKQNKYYVTEDKISDISSYLPHQIIVDTLDEKTNVLKGKILNSHKSMKAYLWTGRYVAFTPDFIHQSNHLFQWPSHQRALELKFNQYYDSIKLSSEQKYILDRKDIKKFPGNLLPMPSTLLNPWDTSLAEGHIGEGGGGGGSFGTRSGGGKKRAVIRGGGSTGYSATIHNNSLEFLPNAKLIELSIQKDGTFEVDIKDFKDQCYLEIGVVSPYGFTKKELALTPSHSIILDNRQSKNDILLDDKLPTTSMSVIHPDKPIVFLQGEEKEVLKIDSLQKLRSTLKEITENFVLNDFDFLDNWSSLTESDKLLNYQKYACHELHFYIYQKDQKFFNSHIKPFLKNKQQKTFIDQWLLAEDLSSYLNLNQFNQLNLFEKILLVKRHPALKEKVNMQIKDFLEIYKPNRESEIKLMNQLLNAVQSQKELKNFAGLSNPEMENEQTEYLSRERLSKAPLKRKLKSLHKELNADKQMQKEESVVDGGAEGVAEMLVDTEENEILTQAFYRDTEDTKEYAEANYFHLERKSETKDLIRPSQFWLDYLNNTKPSFISENILSFENIHEVLLALSLIELPETIIESSSEIKGHQITINSKAPMIVLLKSFKIGSFKSGELSLKQHYYFLNSGKKEMLASENPFLINKQYGCLSVITNTTAEIKEFYFNFLIPEGALPLDKTKKKQQVFVTIQPYTSFICEHQFFFPLKGLYSHLPGKAVDLETIFTNEKSYAMTATADQEILDKNSWEYIVKESNKEKILAYIRTHNLLKTNLSEIYYLAKDQSFFEALTSELTAKYYFDSTIWSYSVYHKNKNKLLEFLPNTEIINNCGIYFDSPLIHVDPILLRRYEHKEYFPLIKSRAHYVENGNPFENLPFEMQYRQFIQLLMHKPKPDNNNLLNLVIYTINQQRISEAIKYFLLIKENEIIEKLQYDYLKAYLAFYQEDLPLAERILHKHKDLAIPQWKEKFDELSIQLSEIKTGQIDSKSRGDKFTTSVLADKEATLKAINDQSNVNVSYKNINLFRADYYLTDLEILFSNSPFEVLKNQFQFLTVPNFSETINLNINENSHLLKIPENLKNKNLVIKISSAGKESIVNYNPNQMDITISENYGELRIVSVTNKKPLSGVYVKVYGENNGNNEFIKDGYSDLRGIFNYATVSGKPISQFKKLAILVISDKNGASIQYTTPPAQ